MNRVRYPLLVVCCLALVGLALFEADSRGWVRLPFWSRSSGEQRALLADGRCAVRPNGDLAGKIISESREGGANADIRYRVSSITKRRTIEVSASEVGVVPCASFQR